MSATHEVFNQVEPLVDVNLFDRQPRAAGGAGVQCARAGHRATAARWASAWAAPRCRPMPAWPMCSRPSSRATSRFGHRIDQVEFHPSYHALMTAATAAGLHGTPFAETEQATGHAHVKRAAAFMLFTELEPSIALPDLHDLRGHARAAGQPGHLRRLGAAAHQPRLRPGAQALERQARRDHGHGHDREAGRLGRARQHHAGRARWQRRLGPALPRHRPQVVFLGADVRRLPDPGADAFAA